MKQSINMNTLKKLQFYMGKRKVLMPIALTLSGLSGLLSLMPFIFIWLIVRSLLLTGSVASGIPINVYAWWAVGTAVAGLVIYFAGLMLLHLAAFRVETNMRRTAMRKIMQMPLGFFDRNTSGQMRKIIDENASETHTFVAHLLPDLAGKRISFAGTLSPPKYHVRIPPLRCSYALVLRGIHFGTPSEQLYSSVS